LATFFLAIEWLLATGTRTMKLIDSEGALCWKQSTFAMLPCSESTDTDSNADKVFRN